MKPAVRLRADGLNLTADNLSSKLDLAIDAQNLSVPELQPYFTDYLNVTLSSNLASTKGKLKLVPHSDSQKLVTYYNGTLSLANFRVLDKETPADFLTWKLLDVSGINASIGGPQQHLTLGKIALDNFYARIVLSESAKLNLQDIVVSKNVPPGALTPSLTSAEAGEGMGKGTQKVTKPTAEGSTTIAPIAAAAPKENVPINQDRRSRHQRRHINYTDNFVKPNFTANMTGMNGTVGEIASDKAAPAAPIDLNDKIDNDAPVAISGSLNPLFKPIFLDIKASAKGVELPRVRPYAAKYAGYAIEKRKLSMDVNYHIENDKLVADNSVRIDQLTFGDKINIDLPISGSLSDPQFSIGGHCSYLHQPDRQGCDIAVRTDQLRFRR